MSDIKFSTIKIYGKDATSYLQSIITQKIEEKDEVQYSLILTPNGYGIGYLFLKYDLSTSSWIVTTQENSFEDVLAALKKYIIRVEVIIEPVQIDLEKIFPMLIFKDEEDRIKKGFVAFGVEIFEKTIPQEYHAQHKFISFKKGCFVGQELVCRIDSRGRVRKCLMVCETSKLEQEKVISKSGNFAFVEVSTDLLESNKYTYPEFMVS